MKGGGGGSGGGVICETINIDNDLSLSSFNVVSFSEPGDGGNSWDRGDYLNSYGWPEGTYPTRARDGSSASSPVFTYTLSDNISRNESSNIDNGGSIGGGSTGSRYTYTKTWGGYDYLFTGYSAGNNSSGSVQSQITINDLINEDTSYNFNLLNSSTTHQSFNNITIGAGGNGGQSEEYGEAFSQDWAADTGNQDWEVLASSIDGSNGGSSTDVMLIKLHYE